MLLQLGMEAARLALFPLAIGSTSVRIKKNMSNIRQIKDRGRSCDDDQLKKNLIGLQTKIGP